MSCMSNAMWSSDVAGRASPGLLRRRYSVPETIMRKYRLAQLRSDGEEGGRTSASPASSPARGACAWCGSRSSGGRRDRDPMRKSALLRLWGRAGTSPARNCACPHCGTRSLDGSHSELRSTNRCTGLRKQDEISDCTYDSHTRVHTGTGKKQNHKSDHNYLSVSMSNATDHSLTDSSETLTTSMPTTKEIAGYNGQMFVSDHIDGRISERSVCAENNDSNVLPSEHPLKLETPTYDILEIVVSETLDVPTLAIKNNSPEKVPVIKNIAANNKTCNLDIDQYVSNILVESLNSLTDQLESMNASMGNDRKMSIVEKEIKVRLQNTGVNTIVHLSPTSNNQIIFGNEELYDSDRCNNQDIYSSNIREETCIEANNNFTSAESIRDTEVKEKYINIDRPLPAQPITDHFLNATADSVNKAVLQQIQKLFQEDLQNIDPEAHSPDGPLPGVSHIEISNVDVFLDNNAASLANANTKDINSHRKISNNAEIISGIGPINYYPEIDNDAIVPRFSAFPHTESMEVNTSSSEDTEFIGSECASLVDSLDDPNSPRSIFLRRSFNNKRGELVRSAIDVLDLLPDNTYQSDCVSPKEKGEAFFIRIKDNNCDCEKENIIVADHMPETIKQRLFQRHRKRELRMECARRTRAKQVKRDIDNQARELHKSKKELEKECMAVINALIDDVIAKIAQDEYKCMRIKQRPIKISNAKSDENLVKRNKKDSNRDRKLNNNGFSQSFSNDINKQCWKTERINRGKFIPVQSPVSTDEHESAPKRIYQKSEIRDGGKCIEILEILEFVNSSQTSSETTNSDENHNVKNKKSRIPVPVSEKIPRMSKSSYKGDKSNGSRPPSNISRERNGKSSQLLENMLFQSSENGDIHYEIPIRRASVPSESQNRSNSRFRNVFDIIPEERSSLSLESTDEGSYRRASAPSINTSTVLEKHYTEKSQAKDIKTSTRSTGTSPMPDVFRVTHNVAAMTSPIKKSASKSPIKVETEERDQSNQRTAQKRDGEGSTDRRHSKEDKIPTIRLKGGRSQESNRSNSTDRRSSEELLRKYSKNTFPQEKRKIKTEKEHRKEKDYMTRGKKWREQRDIDDDSSSSSSGGLLCSLAPAWLSARRRRRRATNSTGEWAVTVAGSCPAALPNDVEMRLRFPEPGRTHVHTHKRENSHTCAPQVCPRAMDCSAECQAARRQDGRLTLTVKKEASDSSILASKSVKKSCDVLPNLETFRASRSKTRSSVKMQPTCSPHCWLEDPLRARNELSVMGSAIVPERKPRVPTMSERDLTRFRRLTHLTHVTSRGQNDLTDIRRTSFR